MPHERLDEVVKAICTQALLWKREAEKEARKKQQAAAGLDGDGKQQNPADQEEKKVFGGKEIAEDQRKLVLDAMVDGLKAHKTWGDVIFDDDRKAFKKLLFGKFHPGRCRACGGIGHDVNDKCGLNIRMDKFFKNISGQYNAMWTACKHLKTSQSHKEKVFTEVKTGLIARNTVVKQLRQAKAHGK